MSFKVGCPKGIAEERCGFCARSTRWRQIGADAALDEKGSGVLESDEVDPSDERVRPMRRLHDLVLAGSKDRFALDVAITEALTAFVSFLRSTRAPSGGLRPSVRRARDFLLDHIAEEVTLGAVAEHARRQVPSLPRPPLLRGTRSSKSPRASATAPRG